MTLSMQCGGVLLEDAITADVVVAELARLISVQRHPVVRAALEFARVRADATQPPVHGALGVFCNLLALDSQLVQSVPTLGIERIVEAIIIRLALNYPPAISGAAMLALRITPCTPPAEQLRLVQLIETLSG